MSPPGAQAAAASLLSPFGGFVLVGWVPSDSVYPPVAIQMNWHIPVRFCCFDFRSPHASNFHIVGVSRLLRVVRVCAAAPTRRPLGKRQCPAADRLPIAVGRTRRRWAQASSQEPPTPTRPPKWAAGTPPISTAHRPSARKGLGYRRRGIDRIPHDAAEILYDEPQLWPA